ncbi:MAG TPA: EamA family transporter [Candidatus Micrarchaeaceae archaeon]|nr:EamA family transporter [Candidatus Micrarchaeaceae archaeon]
MTSLAIGLALAAAALHGTWNVLVKVSGDPMRTFRRATVVAAMVVTVVAFVAWLWAGRPSLAPGAIALAAISAVLELAYLFLLSAAYRRGELSVVYPIARGSAPLLAVGAGLGILGEKLTLTQLVGVALLLLGILAVTLPQTSGRATVPALLTGVSIAAYSAVDRIGVRLSTPWLYGWLLIVLLAVGLLITGYLETRLARRRSGPSERPELPPVRWPQAAVIGIFMWGGYLLVLAALSIAPLSVVAPVRETAIVAVAVWGIWKLRERRGAALKLMGASATLVGVALLAL